MICVAEVEMEVMIKSPAPAAEFNFDSACTTPYMSAPSSPQRFGNSFYSAPASPTRVSALAGGGVPFDWEEEPGIRKPKDDDDDEEEDEDFAFDFSGQLEKSAFSAADELFDGGKIKPLKPPPRFQYEGKPPDSPKSPKQRIKEAFSPRHRRKDFDPFSAAIEQSRKDDKDDTDSSNQRRGRDPTAARSNSRHKGTRSLSPFRISDLLLDRDENTCSSSSSSSSSSAAVSSFISMWYRKWKLKDLLLFRSASEGRASSKEMMNKYAMLKKSHHHDDVKNASFRSTESAGSTSRRRGPVSAHELHYTVNRAASEEMKRKTFLPYKQGLLGCLGVHPTVPEISKGLASMSMPRTRQQ